MNHAEAINFAAAQLGYCRYLEIGVEAGVTFNAVEMAEKTGVDPDFLCDIADLSGTAIRATSDDFFDDHPDRIFDLIFIDGLHTFEQSLRDLMHSIARLVPGGLILLDDCFPTDAYSAMRSIADCNLAKERESWPDRHWMGDVYKTVVFLNDFLDRFSFAHVDGTLGVVAVWRAPRSVAPFFDTIAEIAACDFFEFRDRIAPKLPRRTIEEIIRTMKGEPA